MKKVLVFIGAALAMSACSESVTAPPAAKRAVPTKAASLDFTCRSGYTIAFDENGNPYCVPDQRIRSTP
ncbi:MAG: hypothetical protein ABI205_07420 [Gemmatimonadaceae bacterium]